MIEVTTHRFYGRKSRLTSSFSFSELESSTSCTDESVSSLSDMIVATWLSGDTLWTIRGGWRQIDCAPVSSDATTTGRMASKSTRPNALQTTKASVQSHYTSWSENSRSKRKRYSIANRFGVRSNVETSWKRIGVAEALQARLLAD